MVTQNTILTREGEQIFFKFSTSVDLNKCLKQIKVGFHRVRTHILPSAHAKTELRYRVIYIMCLQTMVFRVQGGPKLLHD